MLFEQQPSEGVSEARSRAAVIQRPTTLLEQLEEDVQSYDANSPVSLLPSSQKMLSKERNFYSNRPSHWHHVAGFEVL